MRRVMVVMALALTWPGTAAAVDYAPVDAPGPALSVPDEDLSAALKCSDDVTAQATREPVLMVPGTTLSPEADFSWNWFKALAKAHIPYCSIHSPGDAMEDIQVNGEYIVYAIREMHRRTGRKVEVVGHSQGGMAPRWSLRFWPDTRKLVDDLVGIVPSNHGTLDAGPICAPGCAPAIWQQRNDAAFIAAVNEPQETFKGVDYTVAYSHADEVVTPNLDAAAGSSSLRTGDGAKTNIALQDICPLATTEHIGAGTYDAVAYAIAMDALTHTGPADPKRIDAGVCTTPFQPGVDPATFATDFAATNAYVARVLATHRHVAEEPPLACYVTASCPASTTTPPPKTTTTRRCASRRRFTIHLRGRLTRARVTVDGRSVKVRRKAGRLVADVDLRGKPKGRSVVRIHARTVTGRTVRETRRYRRCAR